MGCFKQCFAQFSIPRTEIFSRANLYIQPSTTKNATWTERFVRSDEKMLIGLIADTHDCLPLVDKTIKRLNGENVELVLHAGDYVSSFVIPRFKELKPKLIGVFGNNDGDRELLKKRFLENERLELHGNFAEIPANDLKIALLHGNDSELLTALVNSESFDVVVHGHSHNAEIYRKGKTLLVNPGEVCGYLTGKSTAALLDTEKREARIIEL